MLDRRIPLDSVERIVRTDAVVVLIIEVQRPRGLANPAKLRSHFAILAIGSVGAVGAQANAFVLEQPAVFLLRNVLRKRRGADRREQVGQQQFIKPGRLVA